MSGVARTASPSVSPSPNDTLTRRGGSRRLNLPSAWSAAVGCSAWLGRLPQFFRPAGQAQCQLQTAPKAQGRQVVEHRETTLPIGIRLPARGDQVKGRL